MGRDAIDLSLSPAPAVMGGGLAGRGHSQSFLEPGGVDAPAPNPSKPPYRVPLMGEVAGIPWNGLTVASTFAGCGGSSIGYRMAGYRVLWANEFVPAAQDSYRANKAEWTILDGRDIKVVRPEDVMADHGLKVGELDVLDGSPPCQSFSTAGKRARGWGKERTYEHGAKQLNENLFPEYVRLLRGLMPRAFVAENVSGLVKGVAKGFFIDILRELKASGYRVEARLLDAQWLGVPQTRQRIIFVGVREDLGLGPVFPAPLPYRYSVREALPWITQIDMGAHGYLGERRLDGNSPSSTIAATGMTSFKYEIEAIEGANGHNCHAASPADIPMKTVQAGRPVSVTVRQGSRVDFKNEGREIDIDGQLPCITTPSRGSTDQFRVVHDVSRHTAPPVDVTDRPCRAITGPTTAAHYTVDEVPGHEVQRRKFTIAEVKRLSAFPDDFVLTGTYAQQWERLGNSVPPLMMRAIAEAIRDRVLLPARARTGGRG